MKIGYKAEIDSAYIMKLETAKIWNDRLLSVIGKYMDENSCSSKKELAKRMSDHFGLRKGHYLHQSTISNWTRVGAVVRIRQTGKNGKPYVDDRGEFIYREKRIPFPRSEHILMIKEFFGVDVGYLLGECQSETFSLSSACDYTGLDADSVTKLHVCTGFETAFRAVRHAGFESRDVLRKVFNSEEFFACVASLCELDRAYKGRAAEKRALADVVKRLGDDLVDRALPYVGCHIDDDEVVDQEVIAAAKEIESAIDEGFGIKETSEVLCGRARYELSLAFNGLIEGIYPR